MLARLALVDLQIFVSFLFCCLGKLIKHSVVKVLVVVEFVLLVYFPDSDAEVQHLVLVDDQVEH